MTSGFSWSPMVVMAGPAKKEAMEGGQEEAREGPAMMRSPMRTISGVARGTCSNH